MSTKDRWLFAVSLVISVLPFALTAISLKILPDRIPVGVPLILGPEIETISKNRNLIIGLFCLVPMTSIILVAYLKVRERIDKNFYSVTFAALVISVTFLCFVLYQMIKQASGCKIVSDFDFISVICMGVAYLLALLGVPVYSLKPNDALGFRNRYTRNSEIAWERVHHHCSFVIMIGFTMIGTVILFLHGYVPLIVLLSVVVAFIFYTLLYSRYISNKMKALPASEIEK